MILSSKHLLVPFGGAAGQHATAVAESLGIKEILLHRYSSVLSAYGMALADVVDERQEPESAVWSDNSEAQRTLRAKMEELKSKSKSALQVQGFEDDSIMFEEYLNMRCEKSLQFALTHRLGSREGGGSTTYIVTRRMLTLLRKEVLYCRDFFPLSRLFLLSNIFLSLSIATCNELEN
jgi:5-oxoprolinase (ATP-hydrolysing)